MKRTGFYHVFPFQSVAKGQTVVIYGMGEVGHHYEEQLRASGFCTLAFMTDQNYLKRAKEFPYTLVKAPSALRDTTALIVIANGNPKTAAAIRQQLASWGISDERILWEDLIVGADMVVDPQIIDVNDANRVKRVGYYHLFPFSQILPQEQIILWGMGEVGRNYQAQVEKTKYCKIIGAVDQNAKNIMNRSLSVLLPEQIHLFGDDARVVIANGDGNTASEIREELEQLGVAKERIVYFDTIISTPLVVDEQATSNKRVKPYLAGSESQKAKRVPPMTFAMQLFEYDVVSFDIFDTLILRPFVRPTDLFMILEERTELLEFPQIRIAAERKAREWSKWKRRTTEVTLEEIYQFFEKETGLDAEKYMEMEFAAEKEFCFANPYMLEVYRILREQGMRIVFTSDMYLGRSRMKELLLSCGYDGMTENDIFVSCDYSCGKGGQQSGLYDVVRNIIGRQQRFVHIGDNFQNDVVNARRHGIAAIHYRGVNALGNPHRATFDGMSDLVGSVYGGIVNAHLHNGLHTYSVPYEYGFIYGGLYVLGYAAWIEKFTEEHQIDKVLFLARDGDIYQQIFAMLPSHVDYAYALYSRLPATRLEAERNRHFYFDRLLRRRLSDYYPMTVKEWLELCHIESLAPLLLAYPIDLRQDMDNNVIGVLENFLVDHWQDVLDCYQDEQEAACTYFKSLIGNAKHIAIVDIGWIGSGPLSLRWLIEKKWNLGVRVECLLAGCVIGDATMVSPLVASGSLHSYMFSREKNRNLYDSHLKNILTNAPAFELLSQSISPTFDGFVKQDDGFAFHYGIPEIEDRATILEIQKGIRDFAKLYLHVSHGVPELLRISGYDAYVPFRLISSFPGWFRKYFGDYAICLSIGANPHTAHMETIREIFDRNAHR